MLADDIVVLYRGTVVEQGKAQEVAQNPKHPYTELLLQSIPNPWAPELENTVDLSRLDRTSDDGGCVFRARCPQAMAVCAQRVPTLAALSAQHQVACFLHENAGQQDVAGQ